MKVPDRETTILLVEDEALIAMAEGEMLRRAGYRVASAFTGEAALEFLKQDESIDLVLMDIDLGRGMDGTETAMRILAERELPIVFLTSHAEKEVVEKVKGISRYGYVIKDSGEFVLQETVGTALALFKAHCDTSTAESRFRHILSDFEGAAVQGYRGDGTTLFWNHASERLYQYTSEEALGNKLWDLIIPDELVDEVKRAVARMLRTGKPIEPQELRLVRKDGGEVRVLSSHSVFKPDWGEPEFYCLDVNMEPINKVRSRLRMLNQVFSSLGTDPEENIRLIVRETCRILDAACSLYNKLQDEGASLCTWAGQSLPPGYDPVDTPDGHICYEATMKSQDSPVVLPELRGTPYERSDVNVGKYGLRSYLGYPVSVEGETTGALCIVDTRPRSFDETDLHIIATLAKGVELEERRKQSEEQVRKLLNEKGLLLKEAYHRIKNDMNIVKSMLSLQASRMESDQAGESLNNASRRVAVLSQVYDRLAGDEGVQKLPLNRLIEDLLEELRERFSGEPVRFVLSADEIEASGRYGILTGIIFNELVTNAVKSQPADLDELIVEIEFRRFGESRASLTVADNGAGFPPSVLDGTERGLGLELVQALAGQYDGELSLENSPGARAEVTFRLLT